MKLFILSYRANRTYNDSCHCHPNYITQDSSFECKAVDGIENAAEYIANRLYENVHAEHTHIILENFEAAYQTDYFSAGNADVYIPDEREKASSWPKSFSPGTLTWPNKYDQYDDENYEKYEEEDKRIVSLLTRLEKEIEIRLMAKIGKAKEAERLQKEEEERKKKEEQRKEDEAQLKHLQKKLGKV